MVITFALLKFWVMSSAIDFIHEQLTPRKSFPAFKAGDNITVNYKIIEGNKERIQSFKGDVIKSKEPAALPASP